MRHLYSLLDLDDVDDIVSANAYTLADYLVSLSFKNTIRQLDSIMAIVIREYSPLVSSTNNNNINVSDSSVDDKSKMINITSNRFIAFIHILIDKFIKIICPSSSFSKWDPITKTFSTSLFHFHILDDFKVIDFQFYSIQKHTLSGNMLSFSNDEYRTKDIDGFLKIHKGSNKKIQFNGWKFTELLCFLKICQLLSKNSFVAIFNEIDNDPLSVSILTKIYEEIFEKHYLNRVGVMLTIPTKIDNSSRQNNRLYDGESYSINQPSTFIDKTTIAFQSYGINQGWKYINAIMGNKNKGDECVIHRDLIISNIDLGWHLEKKLKINIFHLFAYVEASMAARLSIPTGNSTTTDTTLSYRSIIIDIFDCDNFLIHKGFIKKPKRPHFYIKQNLLNEHLKKINPLNNLWKQLSIAKQNNIIYNVFNIQCSNERERNIFKCHELEFIISPKNHIFILKGTSKKVESSNEKFIHRVIEQPFIICLLKQDHVSPTTNLNQKKKKQEHLIGVSFDKEHVSLKQNLTQNLIEMALFNEEVQPVIKNTKSSSNIENIHSPHNENDTDELHIVKKTPIIKPDIIIDQFTFATWFKETKYNFDDFLYIGNMFLSLISSSSSSSSEQSMQPPRKKPRHNQTSDISVTLDFYQLFEGLDFKDNEACFYTICFYNPNDISAFSTPTTSSSSFMRDPQGLHAFFQHNFLQNFELRSEITQIINLKHIPPTFSKDKLYKINLLYKLILQNRRFVSPLTETPLDTLFNSNFLNGLPFNKITGSEIIDTFLSSATKLIEEQSNDNNNNTKPMEAEEKSSVKVDVKYCDISKSSYIHKNMGLTYSMNATEQITSVNQFYRNYKGLIKNAFIFWLIKNNITLVSSDLSTMSEISVFGVKNKKKQRFFYSFPQKFHLIPLSHNETTQQEEVLFTSLIYDCKLNICFPLMYTCTFNTVERTETSLSNFPNQYLNYNVLLYIFTLDYHYSLVNNSPLYKDKSKDFIINNFKYNHSIKSLSSSPFSSFVDHCLKNKDKLNRLHHLRLDNLFYNTLLTFDFKYIDYVNSPDLSSFTTHSQKQMNIFHILNKNFIQIESKMLNDTNGGNKQQYDITTMLNFLVETSTTTGALRDIHHYQWDIGNPIQCLLSSDIKSLQMVQDNIDILNKDIKNEKDKRFFIRVYLGTIIVNIISFYYLKNIIHLRNPLSLLEENSSMFDNLTTPLFKNEDFLKFIYMEEGKEEVIHFDQELRSTVFNKMNELSNLLIVSNIMKHNDINQQEFSSINGYNNILYNTKTTSTIDKRSKSLKLTYLDFKDWFNYEIFKGLIN